MIPLWLLILVWYETVLVEFGPIFAAGPGMPCIFSWEGACGRHSDNAFRNHGLAILQLTARLRYQSLR